MPVIQKVTDPKKIVTDPYVLSILAKQGRDKDFVELYRDYDKKQPTSKDYLDLKSGKHILVCQGLPKVNSKGQKICGDVHNGTTVGWLETQEGFTGKLNVFDVDVISTRVYLKRLVDQKKVEWQPQVFLDGIEQSCGEPTLLGLDPTNWNYYNNVIEWSYGCCVRRLRQIEGFISDRHIVYSNPFGEVKVKTNQSGNLKLHLSAAVDAEGNDLGRVEGDWEIVSKEEFNKAVYPVTIGAELTFYSTAGAVDGDAQHYQSGQTWATIRGGVGTGAEYSVNSGIIAQIQASALSPQYTRIKRGLFLYDTSELDDAAEITAVVLEIRGKTKTDGLSCLDVGVVSSAPANTNAIVAGDFNSLGTTLYSDVIGYASLSTTNYNTFTFTPAGRNAVNKSGISKFGTRDSSNDRANSAPTWSSSANSYWEVYFVSQGAGYQPKLIVTYTPAVTEKESSDTGSGADAKKTGEPKATYSRSETGSGVEAMLARGITLPDIGSGVEHILDRALVLISESGSGLDSVLSLLGKIVSDSGTAVENSYLHILEGVKDSSDSGSGAEASSLAASFERDETGEGAEAVAARALFSREPQMGAIDLARVITAAITGAETGTGAEASLVAFYQKKTDSGEGAEVSSLVGLFTGEDSGAGAEAITLLAAMVAHDTGASVESVLSFFRKLVDSGAGEENLLLVGFVGRAMKLITYLLDYSDMTVYTKPYSDLRVFTSEVKTE